MPAGQEDASRPVPHGGSESIDEGVAAGDCYERELEAQVARLERFSSVFSHDLRSPLSTAQGYLDLFVETGDERHLQPIADALGRMERSIEDMLELTRSGRSVTTPEPVPLQQAAEQAWADRGVDTGQLVSPPPVTVMANRSLLRRLLTNLFRNAVEHGGDDVTVEVGALAEPGFYVADDGPGIPADVRDQVFEYRSTTRAGGTGIGLWSVEQVAQAHGWDVRVVDADEGGARFEVAGVERADQ